MDNKYPRTARKVHDFNEHSSKFPSYGTPWCADERVRSYVKFYRFAVPIIDPA